MGGGVGGANGTPSTTGQGLTGPPQHPPPPADIYPPLASQLADGSGGGMEVAGVGGMAPPSARPSAAVGLNEEEIKAFYAAQEDYGGGGGRPASSVDGEAELCLSRGVGCMCMSG